MCNSVYKVDVSMGLRVLPVLFLFVCLFCFCFVVSFPFHALHEYTNMRVTELKKEVRKLRKEAKGGKPGLRKIVNTSSMMQIHHLISFTHATHYKDLLNDIYKCKKLDNNR